MADLNSPTVPTYLRRIIQGLEEMIAESNDNKEVQNAYITVRNMIRAETGL
jgi:hypothetical protein